MSLILKRHTEFTTAISVLTCFLAHSASGQFPDAPRENLPPLPERRAAVLKEFDKDGDSRLNAAEREAARKAWENKKMSERGDQGFFRPPPEIMEEFDTNKDGELDPDESRRVGEVLGPRMQKVQSDYDKNTNGRLDPDEIAAALKDIDDGKLKGVPRMFIQFAGGPPGRRGGPGGPRRFGGGPPGPQAPGEDTEDQLRQADLDRNGRLSAEELATLRSQRAKRSPGSAPVPAAPRP
ncbi:MAG: EF-hand domain-containing protein [Verrucomicrobiales bacterium]|nr:EF-hand domain-containing protein [Verrucomicrobiales bacterium]